MTVRFPFRVLSRLLTGIPPEFDKRTSLGVKTTFPKAMYSAHFISETISKDICAQLAREVVNLVPQVVDYTCCVCEYPSPLPRRRCIHPASSPCRCGLY